MLHSFVDCSLQLLGFRVQGLGIQGLGFRVPFRELEHLSSPGCNLSRLGSRDLGFRVRVAWALAGTSVRADRRVYLSRYGFWI